MKDVNLASFSNWLFDLAEAASSVIFIPISTSQPDNERRKVHHVGVHTSNAAGSKESSRSKGCYACNESHSITKCEQFKNLTYNEKWDLVHNCGIKLNITLFFTNPKYAIIVAPGQM